MNEHIKNARRPDPVVRYPEPIVFDACGKPGSEEAAMKVLEEAAELVEAVKFYERVRSEEWLDTSETGAESALLAMRFTSRQNVLDEAMDVYQAVANYTVGRFSNKVTICPPVGIKKAVALKVLESAAILYSGWCDVYKSYARNVELAVASLISCSGFTEEEIADAYARCVERNREKGRL